MLTIMDPYGEPERTEASYHSDNGELLDAIVIWIEYAHHEAQRSGYWFAATQAERLQRIAGAMGLSYHAPQAGGEAQ